MRGNFDKALEVIRNANKIVTVTGAGISAESGIPTYRSVIEINNQRHSGIWNLSGKFGMFMFGTPIGWIFRPSNAWKMYLEHYYKYSSNAKPNNGHIALYQLYNKKQKQNNCQFNIITQNVDGLHQKSGFEDNIVTEMHGSASKYICSIFGHDMNDQLKITDFNDENFIENMRLNPIKCKQCYIGRARPNVILFFERLKGNVMSKAVNVMKELDSNDVILVIGTSLAVQPVANIPFIGVHKNVPIIEINLERYIPDEIMFESADDLPESNVQTTLHKTNSIFVQGSSSDVLCEIVERL
eukprot:80281_1